MRGRSLSIIFALGVTACVGVEEQQQEETQPGARTAPTETEVESAPSPATVTEAAASAECVEPDPALVDGIAQGLTVEGGGDLGNAQAVEVPKDKRNDQGWPKIMVAAEITGPGMQGIVGAWASGEMGGPIVALNPMAREFSDWGAAAQPGSRAAEIRDIIAGYEEVVAAVRCVEES
jgi:hypothetical protein